MRKINRKNVLAFEEKQEGESDEGDGNQTEEQRDENRAQNLILRQLQKEVEEHEEEADEDESILKKRSLPSDKMAKLRALKLRMNEARKKNLKAVIEENRKNTNAKYANYLKNKEKSKYHEKKQEELEYKGLKDKSYLDRPAMKAAKDEARKNRKKKGDGVFGWDVFNEDSLYRAYNKRCSNMPFYPEAYKRQMENGEVRTANQKYQFLLF